MSKNLLRELTAKLKTSKTEDAERIKDEKNFINTLTMQFISPIKPERFYVTEQQVANMFGLYRYIQVNRNITREQFNLIIKKRFGNDVMVRTLYNLFPNLVDELYYVGPSRLILKYVQFRVWQTRLKEGSVSPEIPKFQF